MCLWVGKEEEASSTAFMFLAQEPVFKWDMEFSLCFGLINIDWNYKGGCSKTYQSLLSITCNLRYSLCMPLALERLYGLWVTSLRTVGFTDAFTLALSIWNLCWISGLIYKIKHSCHKALQWYSRHSGACPLWVGGDEISCDKFHSSTFIVGPLAALLGIFLDMCLSIRCSCIFLVKFRLLERCFSSPLSDVNFCQSVLIAVLFQGTVWWFRHNLLSKPVPVWLSGAVNVVILPCWEVEAATFPLGLGTQIYVWREKSSWLSAWNSFVKLCEIRKAGKWGTFCLLVPNYLKNWPYFHDEKVWSSKRDENGRKSGRNPCF